MKLHLMMSGSLCLIQFLFLSQIAFADTGVLHPLDPLTEVELSLASQIIKNYPEFPTGSFFPLVVLQEPPKSEVQEFKPGSPFDRKALVWVLDRKSNRTYEAVVHLSQKKILSWKHIPHVQPLVLNSEYDELVKIVREDIRWQQAMRKRGITDFSRVWVDLWATGSFAPKESQKSRLFRGISYLKDKDTNFYGRPIEGVVALVDMTYGKVIQLIDTGIIPIAQVSQNLDSKSLGKQRENLKPVIVSSPKGANFEIKGHEISWQKWRFRVSMHPREGLVLHQVAYEDQGRLRSILDRASLSEMVVPYGDPRLNWSWRNALDEGEYGIGKLAVSLEPEVDAPQNGVFLDATFSDDFGKPYLLKNAVGIYERDGGILWKHYEMSTSLNESRRATDLVLFFTVEVGNYDYLFSWIFRQDGSLTADIGLTGIMLPQGIDSKKQAHLSSHSHLVAEGTVAPHHQHFFNYRLDFNIDGEKNSVVEMNSRPMSPGPKNPFHNGIIMEERLLKSEIKARRDIDIKASRKWKIINPSVKNSLGMNSGYVLVPGENCFPYLGKNSPVRKRAGFINHHFWVTPYEPKELYAAGYFPNQSTHTDGLQEWTSRNRSIENRDIVVWYTMGTTHIPRPEEWPVMPLHHMGFKLMPAGFFDRNPALDVPKFK